MFRTVTVGVMSNYALPSEQKVNQALSRSLSNNGTVDVDKSKDLKVNI